MRREVPPDNLKAATQDGQEVVKLLITDGRSLMCASKESQVKT
jgi:hypothetical protein